MNLLVRAVLAAAFALPLALPALAAAAPLGTSSPTLGSLPTSALTRSLKNARQPLMQASYAASIATGTTPLVYVSLTGGNEVLAYPTDVSSPAPVQTITGLAQPAGLAVDANRNLYVVELGVNDVKVFKPGALAPFETLLPAPGMAFLSVAVDARATAYVTTSNGSIAVYPKGATTPTNILSDSVIQSANGIAVDALGNIFLNYVGLISGNTLGYAIGAVPASTSIGETFFHRLNIESAPTSAQPVGMTLDKKGNLVIADTMGVVSIYPPATNTPAMSFPATGLIGNVFNVNLALTGPNNLHLFVAPHNTNTIYEYAYPSGKLQAGITLPFSTVVEGLATSPAPGRGAW